MRFNFLSTNHLFALTSFLLFSLILFTGDSSYAYIGYYRLDLEEGDEGWRVGETVLNIGAEIAGQSGYEDMLPSRHEALIYRSIGEICNHSDDDCWAYDEFYPGTEFENPADLFENGYFDRCSACDADDSDCLSTFAYIDEGFDGEDVEPNCNTIGSTGYTGLPFASLIVGSRWPDYKGMPGIMANVEKKEWFDDGEHDNPSGQAKNSPSEHSFLYSFIDRLSFLDIPFDSSQPSVDDPEFWTVRNQTIITGAASYIVDRFLQAEASVTPSADGTLEDDYFFINNYSKAKQDMSFFFDLTCKITGTELSILTAFEGGLFGGLCAACMIGESNDNDASPLKKMRDIKAHCGDSERGTKACNNPDVTQMDFWTYVRSCYNYAKEDNSDRKGESILVKQGPFFIGQATHTIADSIAHTLRTFEPAVYNSFPLGTIRLSSSDRNEKEESGPDYGGVDGAMWNPNHSVWFDHDGYFGADDNHGMWGYVNYTDFNQYFTHHTTNENTRRYSAIAVKEFLEIWHPDNDTFNKRWKSLEKFIRRWFQFEIPEEMLVEADAPYSSKAGNRNNEDNYYNNNYGKLCTDFRKQDILDHYSDIEDVFRPGGNLTCSPGNDIQCDKHSGICRKTFTSNEECLEEKRGTKCNSRGFCSKYWDPWDLIADEYFINTDDKSKEGNTVVNNHGIYEASKFINRYSDNGLNWYRNISEPVEARKWFKLQSHGSENGQTILSEVPISLIESGGYQDCESPAVVIYDEPGYRGNHRCIGEGNVFSSSNHVAVDTRVASYYVAPKRRACFKKTYGQRFCVYGGINGTAENFLMPPWASHYRIPHSEDTDIEEISWSVIDIDGDGVNDEEDNCLYIPNEAHNGVQSDMDGDGFGDECDRDADGDGILEDADGEWGRGNGEYNPCVGGQTEGCDDNCPAHLLFKKQEDERGFDYTEYFKENLFTEENMLKYSANNYQEDLDFDGIGDVCDEDRDGDGVKNVPTDGYLTRHIVEECQPKVIVVGPDAYSDDDYTCDYSSSESIGPEGMVDCNDYLWTVSLDYDQDGFCDVYNFVDPNGIVPVVVVQNTPEYLDPTPNSPDQYDDNQLFPDPSNRDDEFLVHSLEFAPELIREDRSYESYTKKAYTEALETRAFGEMGYNNYQWCDYNYYSVKMHAGGNAYNPQREDNLSFLVNDAAEYKKVSSLYEACRLDNCIRYQREDPLTDFLCNEMDDAEFTSWAEHNWQKESWPGSCSGNIPEFKPGPDKKSCCRCEGLHDIVHPDDSDEWWEGCSNLYEEYFKNPDQSDGDKNGVGDQCELTPSVVNFVQNLTDNTFEAQGEVVDMPSSLAQCEEEYQILGYEVCEKATGYPVVTSAYPDGISWDQANNPSFWEFEGTCPSGIDVINRYPRSREDARLFFELAAQK